jgi:hypothetical protein
VELFTLLNTIIILAVILKRVTTIKRTFKPSFGIFGFCANASVVRIVLFTCAPTAAHHGKVVTG